MLMMIGPVRFEIATLNATGSNTLAEQIGRAMSFDHGKCDTDHFRRRI